VKTATRAKAEPPGPSLRPGRNRDGMIRGIAVGALLLVVAVAVFLIATSGDDDEGDAVTSAEATIETTTPTETAPEPTVTEAAPAAPAAPAPAPEQARQVENCQPILGNGAPFPVTSSASGGTEPASCTEARSVLLTALNQQATTVEDWRCVIDLTAQTVGVCKSGGRTIQAAGPS
jgi:type IV secretory pathway VirB10-like protein